MYNKVTVNLNYVDEIIKVRKDLHKGRKGAPKKIDDVSREGASLNRSGVVMISAILQVYIQDVFKIAATNALPQLSHEPTWAAYWREMKMWGNPSAENIKRLFLKIGVPDAFEGLSWQKMQNANIKIRLNQLNSIRNGIAHGSDILKVDNKPYYLSLNKVIDFRNFSENFSFRFQDNVMSILK